MRKWAALLLVFISTSDLLAQDLEPVLNVFRDTIDPAATGQSFGTAMEADGPWAVISAPEADGADGAIYVFTYDGGWVFHKRLEDAPVPSNLFRSGLDVAISGEWIAVSFSNGGVALYRRDLGGVDNWGYHSTVAEDDDAENRDLDSNNRVAIEGQVLAVGAPSTDKAPFSSDTNQVGAVLIYELMGNSWTLVQQIDVPAMDQIRLGRFGDSVDLNSGTLAIGSPTYDTNDLTSSGRAWVYQRSGGVFQFSDSLASDEPVGNGLFGAVALGTGFLAVGSETGAGDLTPNDTNDGSVYVFEPAPGGGYELITELVPSQPGFINNFGEAVAVEENLLWSAADDAGYLFRRDPTTGQWTEVDRNPVPVLPAPSTVRQYGTSVALTREQTRVHAIVGDRIAENSASERVGAAFFYVFDDGLFSDSFED